MKFVSILIKYGAKVVFLNEKMLIFLKNEHFVYVITPI